MKMTDQMTRRSARRKINAISAVLVVPELTSGCAMQPGEIVALCVV
jgi:hypothetical protein